MNKTRMNVVLAGAVAMAFSGGVALAAGPMPYDGADSGAGSFTIDHAGFDPAQVELAPCPTGAVCSNGTATDGSGMLMRQIDLNGDIFYQQIIADLGGVEGDFVMEASVAPGREENNNYASKVRMIQGTGANGFFTEQTFQRGEYFNGGAAGNNFGNTWFNVVQTVGGFQTFNMDSPGNPGGNQANTGMNNGTIRIVQDPGTSRMGHFVHVVKQGATAVPVGGDLEIDGIGAISYAAGNRISVTFIGVPMYNGGPTTILADGQEQDHNHRTAEQTDFGVLIYRAQTAANNGVGHGNAGGLSAGVDAQFSQSTLALNELRGFSLTEGQDSGVMYNVDHGSFIGGFDMLADNWADVFGDNPF